MKLEKRQNSTGGYWKAHVGGKTLQKSKNVTYNVRTMVSFGVREKAASRRGRPVASTEPTTFFLM